MLGSRVPWSKSHDSNAKIAQTELTASRQNGRGGQDNRFVSGVQVCLSENESLREEFGPWKVCVGQICLGARTWMA